MSLPVLGISTPYLRSALSLSHALQRLCVLPLLSISSRTFSPVSWWPDLHLVMSLFSNAAGNSLAISFPSGLALCFCFLSLPELIF